MSAALKFPVSEIPESLKKDVDVVIREDKMVYEVISASKGRLSAYYVVTILNGGGKGFASKVLGYDKLTKITQLKASIYDASGKLIRKIKNSEIYDQSAFDGFSLYSDNRLKAIDLSHGMYPYTLEFEYEKEYNSLFYIDGSYFIPGERASVQYASYELIYPPSIAPRYKTLNINKEPSKGKTAEGYESLTWVFENLTPIKFETYSSTTKVIPQIKVAPSFFMFDKYAGDMSSWNGFGQWINSLNKGRNILPPKTIEKVKEITAGYVSKEDKVKAVYEYLQNKTRYVSVQLGIGGYQPFDALTVDQTGYGDCKALSNYMISMLECIGIKSNYVLIRAGEGEPEIDVDFPSAQFNHAIVAVPNEKDTIWLECTSQTNPFGYQGSFTGNRKALLITEDGAKMVNTTQYDAKQNLQSRIADVFIEPSGDAKAKVKTIYTGLQYENDNLDVVLDDSSEKQKKWIQNNTRIPVFDVTAFSFENQKNKLPSATVNLELSLKKYATVSGKRIFLMPNLMNRNTYIPERATERKADVVFKSTYTDIDTIAFHLPDNIYPEALPTSVEIKTVYGEYYSNYILEPGKLVYVRRIKMQKGVFKPELYNELTEFYKNISKADSAKIVFVNKT